MPTESIATVDDITFLYIAPQPEETVSFSSSDNVNFKWKVTSTNVRFSVDEVTIVIRYPNGNKEYMSMTPDSRGNGSTRVAMQDVTGEISWSLLAKLNNAQVIAGPWSSFTVQQSTSSTVSANIRPPRCEQQT
jgi:hypothetical protein